MSNNIYNHFGYLFIMHMYIFICHEMYCLLYIFVHYKSDLGGIYELYTASNGFVYVLQQLFPQVSLAAAIARRGGVVRQCLFWLLVLSLKHLRRVGVTGLFRGAVTVAEQLRSEELVEHPPIGDRVVAGGHVGRVHRRLLRGVPGRLVGLEAAAPLGNVGGRLGALQLRKLLQEGRLLAGQEVMVLQLRLAVVVELLAAVPRRR
jgi:hypothetical protein